MRTTVVIGLLLAALCGTARPDIESLEKFLHDCEVTAQVAVALSGRPFPLLP